MLTCCKCLFGIFMGNPRSADGLNDYLDIRVPKNLLRILSKQVLIRAVRYISDIQYFFDSDLFSCPVCYALTVLPDDFGYPRAYYTISYNRYMHKNQSSF